MEIMKNAFDLGVFSTDLYNYCRDNPVLYIDPSGKWWKYVGAVAGGVAAAVFFGATLPMVPVIIGSAVLGGALGSIVDWSITIRDTMQDVDMFTEEGAYNATGLVMDVNADIITDLSWGPFIGPIGPEFIDGKDLLNSREKERCRLERLEEIEIIQQGDAYDGNGMTIIRFNF
jgi:hypothetical protein